MAAGEYISVSSQADTEKADILREKKELQEDLVSETEELANIYVKRGLDYPLAKQVAIKLMDHDALGAHSRDELGITEQLAAHPFQAAISSALSFSSGAILPLLTTALVPIAFLIAILPIITIILLAVLGALAAKAGDSSIWIGAIRVLLWGSCAMLVSAGIGKLLGVVV
jgi:vacuolar iron transporter family protein